jgi:methylenetetrahydrofolate dehydrogenase (NADP+)/methenyltetrahydrofolate cyclohydrolase
MLLLGRAGINVAGASAVVLGRPNLFGKSMAQMLLAGNATVVQCHRGTVETTALCRQPDVLIAAAGRPRFVVGDSVKPGAAVIDMRIIRTEDGLVRDVDFETSVLSPERLPWCPGASDR